MNPEVLFKVSNGIATLGWLTLIFAGRSRKIATAVGTFIVPALLSLAYVGILAMHWKGHPGGFNSLPDVQLLFTDRWLVLMGWVHYLAFDLFVGSWQVKEARRAGRSHLWTVPTLILTFLFGPLGFLIYLLMRTFWLKPEDGYING